MRRVLAIVTAIVLLGLIGHYDFENEVQTVEYDKQMKQEVIKQWQSRCLHGDVFDVDICKAVTK